MISEFGYEYALKHCKLAKRAKLCELKYLLPFFDNAERVLHVKGRILKSSLPLESVHQHILPKSHYIADMIINHEHELSNHFRANFVISWWLRRVWLCGEISTVRNYLSRCQYCKFRRAKVENQVMRACPLSCNNS